MTGTFTCATGMLAAVTPDTAADFGRALIMPNLVPPVVTGADAAAYRERIMAAIPAGSDFTPMMTLYLTEGTDPDDLVAAAKGGVITAVKLYPAGATTNSASGVRDIDKVMPVLEAMAEAGVPLCVHGEVTDPEIDIFDREAVFIDRVLDPLRTRLPQLRVVMEHVTTSDGVEYVKAGGNAIAATLTTHHLFINRNHILAGGIRPHYYCLPVAKGNRIVSPCLPLQHQVTVLSFLVLTVRRIWIRRSLRLAAVPASIPPRTRWRVWRRFSRKRARLTG